MSVLYRKHPDWLFKVLEQVPGFLGYFLRVPLVNPRGVTEKAGSGPEALTCSRSWGRGLLSLCVRTLMVLEDIQEIQQPPLALLVASKPCRRFKCSWVVSPGLEKSQCLTD